MPASTTFAAPYGRVMSGRGFAPTNFQAHEIPAAGQITRDLPDVSAKSNVRSQMQQAQFVKSLQLLRGMPMQSAMPGKHTRFLVLHAVCPFRQLYTHAFL